MKRLAIAGLFCLLAARAFAACPTTTLTFKDAAGTTQTLCFGGASGAFIPQYQILDSGGTNALGVNASGQIGISNFPATQAVSGTVTANQGSPPWSVSQSTGNGTNTSAWLVEGGCAGQTVANTSVKPFSLASTTALQLVAAVAAKQVYVCSIDIVSATANNVALIEGTQTTNPCDTATAGMAGGTTGATGWNFAANGGLTKGSGQGVVFRTATAAHQVCLLASGSGQVSGSITFAQF